VAPSITSFVFFFIRPGISAMVSYWHGIVVVESVGDVQFEREHLFLLQQARDAGPCLGAHGELRDGGGLARFVRATGLDEPRCAAGGASGCGRMTARNFFVGEELVQVFDELLALDESGKAEGRTVGDLVIGHLREIVIASALIGSFGDWFHVGVGGRGSRIMPAELAFIFCRNLLSCRWWRECNLPVTTPLVPESMLSDRPSSVTTSGEVMRNIDVLVGPSRGRTVPRVEVGVGETHGSELIAGHSLARFMLGSR